MKIYIIWIISILKFFLVKKRFLLLSPPFLEKQYFYDRKSKRFFLLYNRNKIDWGTNWQVFLDDQFSLPYTNYNDTRNKDLLNYTKKQNNNNKTPIIIKKLSQTFSLKRDPSRNLFCNVFFAINRHHYKKSEIHHSKYTSNKCCNINATQ